MRRWCLPALLVALAASCSDSTGPANDLDALQVSVQVDPQIVIAGSAARILVTLRNPLPRTVEVASCPVFFWVQNVQGDVVAGSRAVYCVGAFANTFVYFPLRLKPFQSQTIEFTWTSAETQAVPLGQYDVYGWFTNPDHVSQPAQVSVVVAATP